MIFHVLLYVLEEEWKRETVG